MLQGTIKMYNDVRGFGFIRRDDNQADVFLHVNSFPGTPELGQRVKFDIRPNSRDGRIEAFNMVLE